MRIIFDRTKFPLVEIEPLGSYLHVLPITKIQFERFISDIHVAKDSAFYGKMLELNPRLSPTQFSLDVAWQIFATGILPEEMLKFKDWLGQNYRIIDQDEWKQAANWLETIQVGELYGEVINHQSLNPFAKILLQKIYEQTQSQKALDLCMFIGCIMEWVRVKNSEISTPFALVGKANPKLVNILNKQETTSLINPIDYNKRISYVGFRLTC